MRDVFLYALPLGVHHAQQVFCLGASLNCERLKFFESSIEIAAFVSSRAWNNVIAIEPRQRRDRWRD